MKKHFIIPFFALTLLVSCNKDKEILNNLAEYNTSMEAKGYHFGEKIALPKEVTDNAESISISFGDKETSDMVVDPKFFNLGDNAVTFSIKKRGGETITQDATINVYAAKPEQNINYSIIKEYPHDTQNFTEGLFLVGNSVYESVGLEGQSRLVQYPLGSTAPTKDVKQPADIFSEGISIVGNKLYQLTYRAKKGFIYDKDTFKLLGEFQYPSMIAEGWGMTTDGKSLIVSDGTKNIYFLNPNDPSKMERYISVAGSKEVFDQLNELEFHNGFIYANVWQKPLILKINPQNGEVVGKFDFTTIAEKNKTGNPQLDADNVLNGIAFKGDNMLVTGKRWKSIYEVAIK